MNLNNNFFLQGINADNRFNEMFFKIDEWLKSHPNSKRIQDSITVDKGDHDSFILMMEEYFN